MLLVLLLEPEQHLEEGVEAAAAEELLMSKMAMSVGVDAILVPTLAEEAERLVALDWKMLAEAVEGQMKDLKRLVGVEVEAALGRAHWSLVTRGVAEEEVLREHHLLSSKSAVEVEVSLMQDCSVLALVLVLVVASSDLDLLMDSVQQVLNP